MTDFATKTASVTLSWRGVGGEMEGRGMGEGRRGRGSKRKGYEKVEEREEEGQRKGME